MRLTTLLLLTALCFGINGCNTAERRAGDSASTTRAVADANEDLALAKQAAPTRTETSSQNVSLTQADSANAASQAVTRKIIRNGTLVLEVSAPSETQSRIFSIAETRGGFVVTSEMSQQDTQDKSKPTQSVKLVVRVPALQFEQAMTEIRSAATRVLQDKRTGQDVTEEFIDLEARIKNQRALEGQFLEIMKRANTVGEALDVQRQLAEVRTEIEKIEGRRRFLENQATLSTINVTLQTPTQIVNATGFMYGIRSAFSDGVDAAAAIILALIRVVVALLPILILIVLPAALIARFFIKRARRGGPREEEVKAA
ncbi:MAG TPA: DUF4349 domain-containing protein [Pyrinomonadaceae bacterium]